MARIVIDANVLVSAAFGGTPLEAVSKAFETGEVYLSAAVAAEIEGTIERLSPKLGEEKSKILWLLWKRLRSLSGSRRARLRRAR
jgi:predicted nucleic acid-binding protein